MLVAIAFFRRDFFIWSSYRFAVFWQFFGILSLAGVILALGTLIGDGSSLLGQQPGGYVAFALSGLAFTDIFVLVLNSLPGVIRDNQRSGTFEPLLLAPISVMNLIVCSSLFKFFIGLTRLAMYLGLGVLVLGFWQQANWLSLLCVVLPGMLVFLSIGTLASAFIVLFKQGDPILSSYTWLTAVFGGVFFPITSLPGWLQPVSFFVPLSYALVGLRAALQGASPLEVLPQALALLGAGIVLWPISLVCFNWSVNRAKMEGSLVQY